MKKRVDEIIKAVENLAAESDVDFTDPEVEHVKMLALIAVAIDYLRPTFEVIDPEVMMTFIGVCLDMYGHMHKGFSTVEALKTLLDAAKEIHGSEESK